MSVTPRAPRGTRVPLRFDSLEDRLTPAVTFKFDYSLDTTGFFADATHRAALETAGADIAAHISSTPGAIVPAGGNSWTAIFQHPSSGNDTFLPNLTVPDGTLLVYAGGMSGTGREAGIGGPGGYRVNGSRGWQETVASRGIGDAGIWGGSITFNTGTNWYFGSDPSGLGGQVDFYSIAVHELTHVLGFGTSEKWDTLTQSGRFQGPETIAAYGSAPPVSADGAHLLQGTKSGNSEPVSMQPVLTSGRRIALTQLELAMLRDLGWETNSGAPAVSTPVVSTPAVTTTTATWEPLPGGAAEGRLTVVSGPNDGTIQAYKGDANGRLIPVGPAVRPFGYFGGAVRTATGDVNGDGTADLIVATGPGGGSLVRVLDGRTFADLANPPYQAFEAAFGGGVYLAAGDFDGDGRDEVIVTPDQGGGPRVQVLSLIDGQLRPIADFFGINDPNFRGGARTAVGDINRDGTPELVVTAGFGGGPRVCVIDGTSVLSGAGQRAIGPDFFAFEPGLRNGAFVTVGDLDGDGYGDLTFGAGPGGGPRIMSLSGSVIASGGGAAALERPLANTFAGAESQRGGVRVTAKDLDGDGHAEILTGDGSGGELRVYKPLAGGLTPVSFLNPFAVATPDGVYVG